MKIKARKLSYEMEGRTAIATLYRDGIHERRYKEYGRKTALTKSTINRIETLGYSSKFKMTAVLAFNDLIIFIRPIKE